jgi:ABC-type uncharacterized transport system substrate-binding protein
VATLVGSLARPGGNVTGSTCLSAELSPKKLQFQADRARCDRRESVNAGGLMSYGSNLQEQWYRSAFFIDKILRGASPATMPIEQPTRFELAVNL